jgi:hypothetical protein
MMIRFAQALALTITILGFLALFNGIGGFLKLGKGKGAFDEDLRSARSAEKGWPLLARIAKSIFVLGRKESEEDIETLLQQSGFSYPSLERYYLEQLGNTILFGIFGLVVTILPSFFGQDLPPGVVLGAGFGFAFWGSTRPKAEVRSALKRRQRALLEDMTYNLSRLTTFIKTHGTLQTALREYLATARKRSTPPEERRRILAEAQAQAETLAARMGKTLEGFGGNLFAEMVNMLAVQLAQGIPPQKAVQYVKQFYPYTLELEQFLTILTLGISEGLPLVPQLQGLSKQLRGKLRQRMREAGQEANLIVSAGQALILLFPVMILIMGPMLFQGFQFLK